jgi:phage I-like protein
MSLPGPIDTAGAPALGRGAPNDRIASRVFEVVRPAPDEAAAPEWIEMLPSGVFHGRDGRGPYRVEAPEAVIEATRALGLSAGVPIDYDHATDFAAPRGAPAPAAGWVRELEVRQGAIWGRVQWTARAADAIRAREYRYISPVFQYSVNDGRVTRILRAGLTNNPNLYLSAISAAGGEGHNMDEFLNQLKELLGLSPQATASELLAAIENLVAGQKTPGAEDQGEGGAPPASDANAAAPDPARYVAVAELKKALSELNALRAERAKEAAEHAVDEAMRAGKLTPAQREWAVSYCAADPAGFGAFAARQPAVLKGEMPLGEKPGAAMRRAPAMLSEVETAVCGQLGVPAADYLKRRQGSADFLRLNRDHGGQAS